MDTHTRGTHWLVLATAILAVLGITGAAQAADDPSRWSLKLDLGWVNPSGGGLTATVGTATTAAKFGTGAGAGLRAEFHFTERLGLEIGVFSASSVDVESAIVPGTVRSGVWLGSLTPVTLGLNTHLTPDRAVDVCVGVQVGLVRYGAVEFRTDTGYLTEHVSGDNDFGWGVLLGVDVPVGRHGWSVHGSVRYLDTGVDYSSSAASFKGDMNPTIVSIGIGYAF